MGNRTPSKTVLDAAERIRRYDKLIQKQTGIAVKPLRFDGYVNLLNKYGTQKDTTENYQYESEPTIADEMLSSIYEGNGLFARIIDAPAEEAMKLGFELDGVKDAHLIEFYETALDDLDWEETGITAIKWARLFGGSIAVMLINDGQGVEMPLDWKNIKSIDGIRVYDRSVIQPDYSSMFTYSPEDPFRTRGNTLGVPEYYDINSKYGSFKVHESRCLIFKNGVLPENCTNSIYEMWGMPEYIRIKRAMRDCELAHGNGPKMLERAIQAVYKVKNLSELLQTDMGEDVVVKRLQTIDLARGLLNSIAIDAEGEEYDFRTFSFTGVSEIIDTTCNQLSALTSIPQTILFGRSPAGMNATGESDMENWYSFVARIQKRMLRRNLRYLLSIIFQAGVATGEIDEVPPINPKFKPLWSLSELEEAQLEQTKAATQQAKAATAQIYVGMQAVDPTEVRKGLADSGEFNIETLLDDYSDEELFPPEVEQAVPEPSPSPNNQESEEAVGGEQTATREEESGIPQSVMKQDEDDDEGKWITTENGHHVHLNENGVPDKGNPHVISKMNEGNSEQAESGSTTANSTEKRMEEIASRLKEIESELGECLNAMNAGQITPEIIQKSQALGKERDALKAEQEEVDPNSRTNIVRRFCEEGHPTQKQLLDSFPSDWRDEVVDYTQDDHGKTQPVTRGDMIVGSIERWSGENYTEMKHDPYIELAIKNSSAKWSKGELYRGMSISEEELGTLQVGGTLNMNGLSSWSSDVSPAMSFSTIDKNPILLIDKTKGQRNAIPIAQMSALPNEKEVIYGIDQKFSILSATKKDVTYYNPSKHGEETRKVTVVEVEAIRTNTN